ncbi:STAS/SEC14 domain-containing protein [Blastopirellula sp. J2-11]|uniref:STAS/SEC14 domain-containing protein n=1 Tax=Blastopirellula sp. J2-11 TaxID=2943192 RepID=UPI0021C86E13|nr:STAS/SEC14 domain-containing protein [Blastopirellula sp. J2-11]UUO08327.1 STAS/SEC14 domain-containing protein [Blastopirellula sp. J2-11]
MPIEIAENYESDLLQVTAAGKLTSADYATFVPAVEGMIEAAGRIRILFVMDQFEGWDAGAAWEDTKFAIEHFNDIRKIALIGESSWEKWMAVICKPFTMAEVRFFAPDQRAEALEWLAD